jgi:hypothetical protein
MCVTSSRLKMPKAVLTAAAKVLFRETNSFTSARAAVSLRRAAWKDVADFWINFSVPRQ